MQSRSISLYFYIFRLYICIIFLPLSPNTNSKVTLSFLTRCSLYLLLPSFFPFGTRSRSSIPCYTTVSLHISSLFLLSFPGIVAFHSSRDHPPLPHLPFLFHFFSFPHLPFRISFLFLLFFSPFLFPFLFFSSFFPHLFLFLTLSFLFPFPFSFPPPSPSFLFLAESLSTHPDTTLPSLTCSNLYLNTFLSI